MIIAVGFRVRSRNGVIFRQWAAERHEYMTMADWAKHLDNRFIVFVLDILIIGRIDNNYF